jgi:hypothetical protein
VESITEFFGLMTMTVLSISFAVLLEWLLLRIVFRALSTCTRAATRTAPTALATRSRATK